MSRTTKWWDSTNGMCGASILYGVDEQTALTKLAALEDILCPDNAPEISIEEIGEMVKAKREGRCVILPEGNIQNDTVLWYITSDGNIYKTTANRMGNDIWYYKPKRFYLTRPEAEAALAKEDEKQ